MITNLSRGSSLQLSNIAITFINDYLDTFKGIQNAKAILDNKSSNDKKSSDLSLLVIRHNEDHKKKFKEFQWNIIEHAINENLYKLIAKKEIMINRVI